MGKKLTDRAIPSFSRQSRYESKHDLYEMRFSIPVLCLWSQARHSPNEHPDASRRTLCVSLDLLSARTRAQPIRASLRSGRVRKPPYSSSQVLSAQNGITLSLRLNSACFRSNEFPAHAGSALPESVWSVCPSSSSGEIHRESATKHCLTLLRTTYFKAVGVGRMKAVQISQYSDAGVLTVTTDAPKPSAGDGVVLLEVHVDRVFPVEKVREALPARESG
jgi:hypothetical protein